MRKKIKPKLFLRAHWQNQGLTTAGAAKKLRIAESTLRSYENGNREVSADMAVKMEKALGIRREMIRPELFR